MLSSAADASRKGTHGKHTMNTFRARPLYKGASSLSSSWTPPFYWLGRERVTARDGRLPVGKGITTLANPEGSPLL
jgi:hypothetical protein